MRNQYVVINVNCNLGVVMVYILVVGNMHISKYPTLVGYIDLLSEHDHDYVRNLNQVGRLMDHSLRELIDVGMF